MSRPVRVLSLYEGFFAGGARILHSDLIAGLHAGGDQVHNVLAIASRTRREATLQPMVDDARYQRLARAGIDVATLGRTAGDAPPDRFSYTESELEIASRAVRRADVILSLKEQPIGLLLALRDRGLMPGIPVAACLHRSDPMHSGPALGWLAEASETGLVTATISCADSTSDAYARAGVAAHDRYVVANGIDTDRFAPHSDVDEADTRADLGIPMNAPVIAFVARFDAMKDPGLFLRAVAVFRAQRPDAHFLLCGAGMTWDNPALRELAEDASLGPSSALHPLGIRDDMPALYGIADIVALTSAFGEASPLCLLEGAACGATPVTTNVGDAARAVEGIGLVTPHDPHEIAAAWLRVLEHRGSWRDAALAARPRLGRDRMIAEYRCALGQLIQSEEAAA